MEDHRPKPCLCEECQHLIFRGEIAYENGLYWRDFYFEHDAHGTWQIIAWRINGDLQAVLLSQERPPDPDEMSFVLHTDHRQEME